MKYGRYVIVKELGRGSMGVVYQAHDPQIDRLVALKVLRQDRLTSEAFVHRFLKEAKAIGRLSHPNIVTVYDVGQDHETIYIAMEFLEGEPLNKAIEEKKWSFEEIWKFGIQVAETLDYAHRKGIVHRDVKPSNILMLSNGQIKITDFGIAHIEDSSASLQTQDGEILGTPAYMSPEQVMSRPVDGRSDLFSLGIILYELSTGGRPFTGENLAAVFHSITHTDPEEPAKINSHIPKDFSQIIMKCLRKPANERFETCNVLAEALKSSLLQQQSIPLISTGRKKEHRRITFFALILLILIGLGGGIYYLRLNSDSTTPFEKTVESPRSTETVKLSALKIESIPNGAQIFVDGHFKGQTPTRMDLSVGKHEVRLTLPDYYDWEAQVQLKEEGETPLLIRFTPMTEKKP